MLHIVVNLSEARPLALLLAGTTDRADRSKHSPDPPSLSSFWQSEQLEAMALSVVFSTLKKLKSVLAAGSLGFLTAAPSPPSATPSSPDVQEDLARLGRTLERIQAVLADAEERQITDEQVRLWLREIGELAQDAQDVLDEVEFVELQQRVDQANCEKGKQPPGAPSLRGPLNVPLFREYLVHTIRGIRAQSDKIEADRNHLRLGEEEGVRRASRAPPRPPAAAHVDRSCAFGRDCDVDKVVGMLLSLDHEDGNDEDDPISVVAIHGVDGIGKTTLAQLVFEDGRVESHFEVKLWVWASQDFDVTRLTREIVESATEESWDLDELNSLQEILDKHLTGKRVLLVLDDVWNEIQSYWEALLVSLHSAANGSRVIITTPSVKVAKASGSPPSQRHQLQQLADEASWSLFCHYAFGDQLARTHPRIVEMGKKICRRRGGFPLTLRATAELLRGKTDQWWWEESLAGEAWDMEDDDGKTLCGKPNETLRPPLLDALLQKLWYVRVLDLSDNNISELPPSVGDLKFLRYLGLNKTKITRLPEEISGLCCLQTLELRHCYRLAELPTSIRYLFSLRHLDLHCSIRLLKMPRGIGNLTSIQTLPLFAVGKVEGFAVDEESRPAGIVELEDLNGLRGELHILGLQNAIYGKTDNEKAKMANKEHLEKLHLDWKGEDSSSPDLATQRAQNVLESLQPHANVRELKISLYKGRSFPSWMGSSAFVKLRKVTLIGCGQCGSVSPLGQLPALRSLDVRKMDGIRRVGREFFCHGDVAQELFPSLEELGLHFMAEWEEWLCWEEGGSDFPCLRHLIIRSCPKLASLSLHNLKALRALDIRNCKELACINCFEDCLLSGGLQEEDQQPCLEKMEFQGCPKLGIPPREQPPSAPHRLHANRCPLQRKRPHAEAS
ncbi:hypothetical protein Taro_041065 [Colocasia esculenta]|uniref:Disease resistance RPP13-like protein 1 n=1 Tax=Colocasia esculenta TaxID=4460 RepID=A0A843WDE2_COLES|nr:hypothetical protein [Colocasia esculenta]